MSVDEKSSSPVHQSIHSLIWSPSLTCSPIHSLLHYYLFYWPIQSQIRRLVSPIVPQVPTKPPLGPPIFSPVTWMRKTLVSSQDKMSYIGDLCIIVYHSLQFYCPSQVCSSIHSSIGSFIRGPIYKYTSLGVNLSCISCQHWLRTSLVSKTFKPRGSSFFFYKTSLVLHLTWRYTNRNLHY